MMVIKYLTCFLAVCCMSASLERKSYDGYEVIEVIPKSVDHVHVLRELNNAVKQLDFWLEPSHIDRAVHLLLSSENKEQAKQVLSQHGLHFRVIKDDLQTRIQDEFERLSATPETRDYNYTDFNRYEEFLTELDAMAVRCNAAGFYCVTETWGNSYEGREIKALIIETDTSNPYFYMDSLTHAREWLSGATLMNIVNSMLADADGDNHFYLRKYNWVIVPVVNPDGYTYTWDVDRYWRKTRKPNAGSECVGTDINRNFDAYWATVGSSTDPCEFSYHGEFAADNSETRNIQLLLDAYNPTMHLTFHTYGYYWLEPFANGFQPDNVANLTAVTEATCAALEATYGDPWSCGNFRLVLYAASGTTSDYHMLGGSNRFSWTPELRGDDFVIDDSQITFSVTEIWNGLRAKMDAIEAL